MEPKGLRAHSLAGLVLPPSRKMGQVVCLMTAGETEAQFTEESGLGRGLPGHSRGGQGRASVPAPSLGLPLHTRAGSCVRG